jgi:dTDP-4-dehydrorhamnose 3,5-epimerase
MLSLDDFVDDTPWAADPAEFSDLRVDNQIDGVRLQRLVRKSDRRGDLTVLLSALQHQGLQVPHIYLVTAAARSVRAWVYHKRQSDRLAYTEGSIRIVLYDIRPGSPTFGALNVIDAGADNKVLLTIPPLVIHGVQNRGDTDAQFVNMPTKHYDPAHPDKSRLPADHPGIPYAFG